MIEKIDSIKKQLGELAMVLNAFKSENVQLRLPDLLLEDHSMAEVAVAQRWTREKAKVQSSARSDWRDTPELRSTLRGPTHLGS